jgi:hypothetical protein
MSAALALASRLADDIENFELGHCGPSDDPEKQYVYTAAFRDLAVRFVGAIKRIGDPDLSAMLDGLNTNPKNIVESHYLWAQLGVVIDALRELTEDPNYAATVAANLAFLDHEALARLKAVESGRLDCSKLIRMCEELNDAYSRANFISATLLIKAIMNHVPPVFHVETFAQVVANAGRSVKSILGRLENEARPVADLHTHIQMRTSESLPSKNQLEPYKAAFEVLIHQIIARMAGDDEE